MVPWEGDEKNTRLPFEVPLTRPCGLHQRKVLLHHFVRPPPPTLIDCSSMSEVFIIAHKYFAKRVLENTKFECY